MTEIRVFRLSELYIDYDIMKKLLNKNVVTQDGRELGIIRDIYLNNDGTPRKVVLKNDYASFYVDPKHLFLVGDKVILQEPTQIHLAKAMRETLKAAQELLEAISQKDPEKASPNVANAKQHLKNALSYLEASKE
jgi:sporulation protein YlmC with PRC-barrel domain